MHRALVVGISEYGATANPLPGSINDMLGWKELLSSTFNLNSNNLKSLRDKEASKQEIINGFNWLLSDVMPGDHRLFFFAGHGSRLKKRIDNMLLADNPTSETIVAYPENSEKIESFNIFDYELANIIDRSNFSSEANLTIILDSCHAGGMMRTTFGDLDPDDYPEIPRCWIPPNELHSPGLSFWPINKVSAIHPQSNYSALISNGPLSIPRLIIAAAHPEQAAWDDKMEDNTRHGVFSFYALKELRDNPSITWGDLIEHTTLKIKEKFPQRPMLVGDQARFATSLHP